MILRFFLRKNLSRTLITHTRQDSLATVLSGKNSNRTSNTRDLRRRLLYFAQLDTRIVFARNHFTRERFQRLESRRANSRSCKQQIASNLRVAQATWVAKCGTIYQLNSKAIQE